MLFILILTGIVKNTATDLVYAVQGKTPPRHAERMERLRQQGTRGEGAGPSDSGFGSYWGGVWDDSWRDADIRRRAKRERKGRRGEMTWEQALDWAKQDHDHDIIRRAREEVRREGDHEDEQLYQAIRQAEGLKRSLARQQRLASHDVPDAVPPMESAPEPSNESENTEPAGDQPLATVTPLNPKEHPMSNTSGETTNLGRAKAYTEALKAKAGENVVSLETSIALLTQAGVTGDAIAALRQCQEKYEEIVSALSAAGMVFDRHATGADWHAANQDAGDKAYLVND